MAKTSLSMQLSWRVGFIQIATFIASMVIAISALWQPSNKQIPRQLAQDVAAAIDLTGSQLTIARDRLPSGFLEDEETAWIVARSSNGDRLEVGTIPYEVRSVADNLSRFRDIDMRSEDGYLASASATQKREWGTLWVMVGGAPERGFLSTIVVIVRYIGVLMFLPVLVATLLLIPWTISRRLQGLRLVASEAAEIDLGRRGSKLKSTSLPSEIQPLIESFNQALDRIWESASARDRFLRDAAHELRMPMAVLRTRLSALQHGPDKLRLMNDLSRLENIAEQLLDLQRLSHREQPYSLIDLNDLCDNLAAEIAPVVLDGGYQFSFKAAPDHLMVLGDRGALERMLKNLLHNAITHGGHRGEISLEVCSDGWISVADNGPGIPRGERERVFAPFYRLNSAINGSGLGLHLAEEVASKHGGRIRVSDSSTGGALFEIWIPPTAQDPFPEQERGDLL
ncbi:hypothetical protein XB05_19090 [Xanthomonas arboricola]|uniref:sensor histidine kinase n=1 Tax=Xanthomonas arboricola TaxID=56448 RepID=UPI00061A1A50|nr:HAMP domain-containing sensor histidine kinase [Xanthomonas arboricola]AKC80616.1 hypothetical protein XB05_19090 [Xanthomonas arboricola]